MSSPLRVMAFLHSFEPGGVERVALRLCKYWQAEGAEVTVLLGRRSGALGLEAPKLDYVTYSSGPVPTAAFETAWMIWSLWRRVRADRPDVIFCAGNTYTIVAVALRLLLGRRCPPIVAKVSNSLDRRDLIAPFRWAYLLWLRLQGPLIDRWVAMAETLRPEISRAMRVPADRIDIIHDPALSQADAAALATLRDRADRSAMPGRLFLSAGRLTGQKRFDILIRAFDRGADDLDRLVILGAGPHRKRLEALVERLDLTQRVHFPGHSQDLASWFAMAHAFVLASDYEGVPAVIVEAMAAGVPIIATHSSAALPELVGHGRFGRLVRCRDEHALAGAIATSEAQATDMTGARLHAGRFVVERAARAYLDSMQTAAAERDDMRPAANAERGARVPEAA